MKTYMTKDEASAEILIKEVYAVQEAIKYNTLKVEELEKLTLAVESEKTGLGYNHASAIVAHARTLTGPEIYYSTESFKDIGSRVEATEKLHRKLRDAATAVYKLLYRLYNKINKMVSKVLSVVFRSISKLVSDEKLTDTLEEAAFLVWYEGLSKKARKKMFVKYGAGSIGDPAKLFEGLNQMIQSTDLLLSAMSMNKGVNSKAAIEKMSAKVGAVIKEFPTSKSIDAKDEFIDSIKDTTNEGLVVKQTPMMIDNKVMFVAYQPYENGGAKGMSARWMVKVSKYSDTNRSADYFEGLHELSWAAQINDTGRSANRLKRLAKRVKSLTKVKPVEGKDPIPAPEFQVIQSSIVNSASTLAIAALMDHFAASKAIKRLIMGIRKEYDSKTS